MTSVQSECSHNVEQAARRFGIVERLMSPRTLLEVLLENHEMRRKIETLEVDLENERNARRVHEARARQTQEKLDLLRSAPPAPTATELCFHGVRQIDLIQAVHWLDKVRDDLTAKYEKLGPRAHVGRTRLAEQFTMVGRVTCALEKLLKLAAEPKF